MTTAAEFAELLAAPEGTNLECKEARNRFDFDELVRYCVALAIEGGGVVLLAVTNLRPRRVVGCHAFPEPGLPHSQLQKLLQELRKEGRIAVHGQRRWARWFVRGLENS